MRLTVEEAAQHYGVSTATIRRRVKAEELPHERESDQPNARLWIVIDDDVTEEPESKTDGASTRADAASTHDVEATSTLVGSLESQVTFLRSELDTRTREVSELHQLLRQEQLLREQAKTALVPLEPRVGSTQDDSTAPTPESSRLVHTYLSGLAGGAAPLVIAGFISLATVVWKLAQGIDWNSWLDVGAAVLALVAFGLSAGFLAMRWWRNRDEALEINRELRTATTPQDVQSALGRLSRYLEPLAGMWTVVQIIVVVTAAIGAILGWISSF